jgi:hypothetical protein
MIVTTQTTEKGLAVGRGAGRPPLKAAVPLAGLPAGMVG